MLALLYRHCAAIATAQQYDDSIQSLLTDSNFLELSYQPISGSDFELLGDIFWGHFRPIISTPFRKDIFDHFHSLAHPGQKASFRLISCRFFWPGMQKDIQNFCKTCLSCQQSKIQRHTISPTGNFSLTTAKFPHVHVDIVGPLPVSSQHSYILTIVDRYSRWFDAIPLTRITSRACVDAFILHSYLDTVPPKQSPPIEAENSPVIYGNLWPNFWISVNLYHLAQP